MAGSRPSGQLAFVGRARLVEKVKVALDAGLDIWLTGEHGVGKTALAKRVAPDAIYCPHVTPAKEFLFLILSECYRRGWYVPDGDFVDDEVLHLLGDAATKSGVPLMWPNRARFVFPGNAQYRLTTGSLAEIGVLAVVLMLGALTVPVARYGPRRLLHLATGSMFGAVRDAEEWSADYELEADVEGYNVLTQRLVSGRFRVVGRRGGAPSGSCRLIIESQQAGTGVGAGYWILAETGDELYRIAPRHVRIEKRSPRQTQTVVVHASNITLAALSRELLRCVPDTPSPEPRSQVEVEAEAMTDGFGPNDLLITGQGECYPFPQDPLSAPVDTPANGLKTVTFSGQHISFDFAQPRHLASAGTRVALKSATLTIQLPRGVALPRLNFPPLRRVVVARSMLRHADLLVREGDLVRQSQPLNRTFAQQLEHEPTPQEQLLQAQADQSRRELLALEVEERAMKRSPLWAQLAQGFVQRRRVLQRQADWRPPVPPRASLPAVSVAPFDGVVENVEWEPPTLPTQRGEKPEHAAQVALVRVKW